MDWDVIISPQSEKDLEGLENAVSDRVKKKLKDFRNQSQKGVDPDHYLKWINKYEVHPVTGRRLPRLHRP